MARQESEFQGVLNTSFQHYERVIGKKGIWFKHPDPTKLEIMSGHARIRKYDNYCFIDGKHYAMEQKMNRSVKTFNFKEFFPEERYHQLLFLEKEDKIEKSYGWCLINHYKLKAGKRKKIDKTYAFPAKVVREAYEIGTVSLQWVLDHPDVKEIPKTKDCLNTTVWDLSLIFN